MSMKLALGTANFGQAYGIANTQSMSVAEIKELVQTAFCLGIRTLETSSEYKGTIDILDEIGIDWFDLIFKTRVPAFFNKQSDWKSDAAMLFHGLPESEEIDHLAQLKERGCVKKVGFSCYSPEDIEEVLELGFKPDIVQIPTSIFDQRFVGHPLISKLKDEGCEIHARSIFLQGAVFLKRGEIPDYLMSVEDKIAGCTWEQACGFIQAQDWIDCVVLGANSAYQLRNTHANLVYVKHPREEALWDYCKIDDLKVLLPMYWGK